MTNGVQVGRSFFPRPSGRPKDLGDFYELWTGLFQSTILGRIPYVNVDVAHKAFPTPMPLIEIMGALKRQMDEANSRYRGGNQNAPSLSEQLQRHLKGLRIVYEMSGNAGVVSYKSYKFLSLGQQPAKEFFTVDGQETSVLEYFANKGVEIKYPQYPCIKAGNSLRSIALPPEFCHIPAGQVSLFLEQFDCSAKLIDFSSNEATCV